MFILCSADNTRALVPASRSVTWTPTVSNHAEGPGDADGDGNCRDKSDAEKASTISGGPPGTDTAGAAARGGVRRGWDADGVHEGPVAAVEVDGGAGE